MTFLQDAIVTLMAVMAAWSVLRRFLPAGPSAPASPPCSSCPNRRKRPR